MLLAVDIGNTHSTIGLIREGVVSREWRLSSRQDQTADELSVTMRFLPGIDQIPHGSLRGGAICSVVPALNANYATALEPIIGAAPLVLCTNMDLGIRNEYAHPNEVGMDRLANAVAGHAKYGKALAILDFGTATTVDVVSREGNYLGGVILAGVETTADALHRRTAKLPRVAIERPTSALGKTTSQSILSGLYFGAIDAAQGVIARIEKELGYNLRTIATGGLATVVAPDMARLEAVDRDLTLCGIEILWERNRGV